MKTINQFFLNILIVWGLTLSKELFFFQSKPNLWWRWRRLPKICEFDPVWLELVGKKNNIIVLKYINISNIHLTVDTPYLKLARASS